MANVYLIGTGMANGEGLSIAARTAIESAQCMVGRQAHLDLFPLFSGEKRLLGDLTELLAFLQKTDQTVVVFASGDPNFFGVGRFLLRNLPKDRIEIFANVTSMQYAFARIKEPWDDAIFLSIQGRGMGPSIDKIIAAEKACILTDEVNTPAAIARELIKRGADGYEAWLCEDLGHSSERFTKTTVRGLLDCEPETSSLNILILVRAWEPTLTPYPLFGIDDDEFASFKKLFTRQEVRAIALAKLKLQNDLVLWDIGAGSGSVTIEAANLMPNGKLFAIERNAQYAQFLQQNLEKFTVSNVKVVAAEAPQGLDDLPDPDRVFIGGAGGGLEDILDSLDRRLKADGVIVITAVTLDTLTKAVEVLEYYGYAVEVVCVNVAKTKPLTEYKLFEAQIPVYLITAVRSQDV